MPHVNFSRKNSVSLESFVDNLLIIVNVHPPAIGAQGTEYNLKGTVQGKGG
jgi:hypothetical protein